MKKYLLISLISLLFVGCVPSLQFNIESMSDKFTSTPGIYSVAGNNNKVSNTTVSGYNSNDLRGFYIDPLMIIDTANNKIVSMQLACMNYDYKFGFARPLHSIFQIIILNNNNQKITLYPKIFEYNYESTYGMYELYFADISLSDYNILVNSEWVEIKIVADYNVVYERKDILTTFIPNLKAFNSHISKFIK